MNVGNRRSHRIWLRLLVAGTLLGFLLVDVAIPGAAGVSRVSATSESQAADAATLEIGRPIEQSIAGAVAYTYRLPLAPGEFASLTVVQTGVDVVVRALDSADQVAAEYRP